MAPVQPGDGRRPRGRRPSVAPTGNASRRPRVTVVGSYGVGLVFSVDIAPGSGETVHGRSFRIDHGGKGSNQAVGAARLGADVRFLTALGEDDFAPRALRLWDEEGIAALAVRPPGSATMAGAIIVEASGENRIIVVAGALGVLSAEDVRREASVLDGADVLLVQLEIPLLVAAEGLALARARGLTTILNPAPAPDEPLPPAVLASVDYLTPNLHEARRLLGRSDGEAGDVVIALARATGRTVIMTVGAQGALIARGDQLVAVPAQVAPVVVDSTGAGDAFNAGFAFGLASGLELEEAVALGCRCGAWCVGRPGVIPGLPRLADVAPATGPVI